MIEHLRNSEEGQKAAMNTILKVVDFSSSAWYGKSRRKEVPSKRGPKCIYSDEQVLSSTRGFTESRILWRRV